MRIATLGPTGSNHELVASRYLNRHAPQQGDIVLYTAFEEAFEDVRIDLRERYWH